MEKPTSSFAPVFVPDPYTSEEKALIGPFFTNLDRSVYALMIPSAELAGALCSRMSRAKDDIRRIFLREFIQPFLSTERPANESDEAYEERRQYGAELRAFIEFLPKHPFSALFSNPRARKFYFQWLAEYGDDSIAQMGGMHLAFSGISNIAIKHIEDMRIGIAPIEKSTRYVDYSQKVGGRYLYYTDPTLEDLGLRDEYETSMDGLFETYRTLIPRLIEMLKHQFPDVDPKVIEKKAFDTLRGLLPMATLSQVSFFGNGQAMEYKMSRSLRHRLGEIRWAAATAKQELSEIAPSFFRRLDSDDKAKRELAEAYQEYLAGRKDRMTPFVKEFLSQKSAPRDMPTTRALKTDVRLLGFDPEGEDKVVAGLLYDAPNCHESWTRILGRVRHMDRDDKRRILASALEGRTARWWKVPRPFEHASYVFEIEMNIGAWRDLHRHRMLTQQHQFFTCRHGYDMPPEIEGTDLEGDFRTALERAEMVYAKIEKRNPHLAQYAVPLAYRIRFLQRENIRQGFWQIELRTISQGHPDYRHVEQEKYRQLQKAYPLLTSFMLADMNEYDFARRETEARIKRKKEDLGV